MSVTEKNEEVACFAKTFQELSESEQQMINLLNQVQEKNGYISQTDLRQLAALTGQPEAKLHGLVSFFDSFRTRPLGKNHLSVCYGTACYTRGANLLYDRLANELELDADGTSTDGWITLDKVQCVGACSLAPVISVNGKLEGKLKAHQMPSTLQKLRDDHAGK